MYFSLQNLVPTFYAGRRPDNSISSSRSDASSPDGFPSVESGYHSVIRELTGLTQNFS